MYSQFKDRTGVYPKLINNSTDDLDTRGSWKKLGFLHMMILIYLEHINQ